MAQHPPATDHPAPLTPREVAQLLRSAAAALRAELMALPPRAPSWHPAPGEWCIKEILGP